MTNLINNVSNLVIAIVLLVASVVFICQLTPDFLDSFGEASAAITTVLAVVGFISVAFFTLESRKI